MKRFDINKTITYKGWIIEVLKANRWSSEDMQLFKLCMLRDISGMAKTWLKDGRKYTYLQTFHAAIRINESRKINTK